MVSVLVSDLMGALLGGDTAEVGGKDHGQGHRLVTDGL